MWNKIKFSLFLIIPIVLLVLPANFFDNGQSICPSKYFLNRECPGCGITRGLQHLGHLDFNSAWEFNKLSYLIFPIAIFFWLKELRKTYFVIFKNYTE